MSKFIGINGQPIDEILVATQTADGLMSKEDKKKLDNLSNSGDDKYVHPDTHPATMITEDETHRFVTDTEKSTWNAKASTALATDSKSGLMSKEDKAKLDNIATGANNYTHPANHPATMITQDSTHRFVTDTEKSTWNAKASTAVATTSSNGLMASTDKSKLDGIAANANKYVHPDSHPATMITTDTTHRFVTDAEKTAWNASTNVATQSANGLMSKSDKTKLDGIATGANKYVHPSTHAASMINGLTASRALVSSSSGILTESSITSTELGYLDGAKSNIQTQIDNHGNHVPATQTANNAKFLRNDNTWQTVNPDYINAARGSRKSASTAATTGWYRIATTSVSITNNIGTFLIQAAVSGAHSSTIINCGITYGTGVTLQQISHSAYSITGISKVRIVYNATYDSNYAYLEVYIPTDKARTIEVELIGDLGWTLVAPSTAGGIPSGYTSKEITLVSGKMVADINGTVNGYSISASVPSGAKFTDTVYTHPSTHSASMINGLTASRALVSTSGGILSASSITATELGYLDGVKSNIQTQLNGKSSTSHSHNYLVVPDTRDTNPAPKDSGFKKNSVGFDFKYASKIGTVPGNAETYVGLMSFAPWSETSGGNGYQLVFGAKASTQPVLAIRSADLSATSWGTFYKVYTSIDKPTASEIGAAASSHSHSAATQSAAGYMSAADKKKLDGIATGANKYVHPSTHAATMITADSTHRFVTDTQISTWNAKASTAVATTSANGLMSKTDKAKLDGIATGATKNVVDSSLSSTSTNAIQNKAVWTKCDSLNNSIVIANRNISSNKSNIQDLQTRLATGYSGTYQDYLTVKNLCGGTIKDFRLQTSGNVVNLFIQINNMTTTPKDTVIFTIKSARIMPNTYGVYPGVITKAGFSAYVGLFSAGNISASVWGGTLSSSNKGTLIMNLTYMTAYYW